MKKVSIIVFGMLTLMACDPNRVYEQNIDLNDAIWKLDEKPRFTFEVEDATIPYNLYINIRNTLSYPFHNIYIKYHLKDSLDSLLGSEMKEFFLFDPKTGKPRGDGLGDIFDNRFFLLNSYNFSNPGEFKVELEQFMRLDSLPMLVSLGVRVEKSAN